jgi:hypothetical protein
MKKTDMNLSQVDHQGSLKLQELQVWSQVIFMLL